MGTQNTQPPTLDIHTTGTALRASWCLRHMQTPPMGWCCLLWLCDFGLLLQG